MPRPANSPAVPLVFIHGDDEFAVKQRAKGLYEQWCAEVGGMDHEIIDAQAGHSGEALKALGRLREALQTLPFFGTGKVVWFRQCNFLGDERAASAQGVTEGLADLAEELKAFSWQNVRLLISAGEVDKRKKFYKAMEKLATVESHAAWSMDDKNWAYEAEALARRTAQEQHKEIREEALAELVANVGPNRRQLINEVEKLCLYAGGEAEIGLEAVGAIVTRNKQARAFALGDALGERDLPKLLRRLDEELWELKLDRQRSEIGLLYGLITKVRAMLFLKEMMREGWVKPDVDFGRFKAMLDRVPADQLPADRRFNPLAQNPYVLYKALGQARRYSTQELVRAMQRLLECNQRLISSALDGALVLQQTLVQIVRGEPKPVRSKTA
jgi:DNA polymerase III subunit delta